MEVPNENRQAARLYLLGRLDDEARLRLEERLLTDDGFYEELLVCEQELCEEYLSDELAPAERASFESFFLATPERRRQLNVTRAFRRYVADHAAAAMNASDSARPAAAAETAAARADAATGEATPRESRAATSRPTPFWQRLIPLHAVRFTAAWALLLVAFGCVALLYFKPWQGRPADAEQELARLNAQAPDESSRVTRAAYVGIEPPPAGVTRGDGQTYRVKLPADIPGARLRFEPAGDEFESYRAQLKATGDAARTYTVGDLRPVREEGARVLLLYVPARLLPPGDYQVKLSGRNPGGDFEDLSTYNFRVVE